MSASDDGGRSRARGEVARVPEDRDAFLRWRVLNCSGRERRRGKYHVNTPSTGGPTDLSSGTASRQVSRETLPPPEGRPTSTGTRPTTAGARSGWFSGP